MWANSIYMRCMPLMLLYKPQAIMHSRKLCIATAHSQHFPTVCDSMGPIALSWLAGADSLLPEELQALANEQTSGRIAVIALDATWQGARRMRCAYPKGMRTGACADARVHVLAVMDVFGRWHGLLVHRAWLV